METFQRFDVGTLELVLELDHFVKDEESRIDPMITKRCSSAKLTPSTRALRHQLPRLYHHLVPHEILNFQIIETKASCDRCAMSREVRGPRAQRVYAADLKCCTFDPILPNYLVGAILEDPASSGWAQKSMRNKLSSYDECLPLGVRPSSRLQREFLRHKETEFGLRASWRCPYLDPEKSNCSIWRHRGSVCTSFYCFSDFGARGMRFWEELGGYLHLLEMTLMEEALVHLDFSPRQISELLAYIDPREYQGRRSRSSLDEREWKKLWNSYSDPDDFFRKCYAFVSSLKRRDVDLALGEAGENEVERLLKRLHHLEKWRTS